MDEKDDFDVFIETAENVVRLIESGQDAEYEKYQLAKQADLVSSSNIPLADDVPAIVCKILANHKRSVKTENIQDVRKRRKSETSNSDINTITISQLEYRSPCNPFIFILFCFLLVIIMYYLLSPTPCPRPIW
ncbi:hypothetical protein L3Y34_015449 [Caenorhabditis briggsae]|uniref:Uncharacterized protein n=1 Tax=Caenorhabditis briggsae TaxID=6238 RepID=A0AAE9DUT0_CAEBR|nr:hypothetical protein L3Y34_015449 [Caenorhabditis briggsae]